MNDNAFTYLKYTYEEKKGERDKAEDYFCSLLRQKDKLEKNPTIVKYLKLIEEIDRCNDYFIKDEELLNQSFRSLINSGYLTDTNEIYFYYGTFILYNGESVQVPRNSGSGEYDLYKDIESCKYLKNPINSREEFESNHKVIVFPKPFPSNVDFNDVHKDFLYTSLNDGQEVACKKVLARKY